MDLFVGLVALFFLSFFKLLFNIFILIIFLFFILITLFIYLFFLSFFFLPFLLSRVADRVMVLPPGVKPESLSWESQVHEIGPPETSRPHIISISKSSPRDLYLNAKNELHSLTRKLQCWTPHAKQQARQEHNPIH